MEQRIFGDKTGKDEMNLCDLPFFILDNRTRGEPVAHYSREVKRGSEIVNLELTVKGDPELGLPSTREEELTLAILKVSKNYNDFGHEKVLFTQPELLYELGWGTRGDAYKRLYRAFATLNAARYQVNGWRDNAAKEYTFKGGFQIITDYMLKDARRKKNTRNAEIVSCPSDEAMSYFHWGPVLFQSFQSGYLKDLDDELIKKFEKAATTRLYRYLDKITNPPDYTRVEEQLKDLAYEQMVIPRGADLSGIRRRLEPAIDELVKHGYLVPMPWKERISKKINGERTIVFERQLPKEEIIVSSTKCSTPKRVVSELETYLISLGVESGTGPTDAQTLVETLNCELLRENAERFEAKKHAGEKVTVGLIISATKAGREIRLGELKTKRMQALENEKRREARREADAREKMKCEKTTEAKEKLLLDYDRVKLLIASLDTCQRKRLQEKAYKHASFEDREYFTRCESLGLSEGKFRLISKYLKGKEVGDPLNL